MAAGGLSHSAGRTGTPTLAPPRRAGQAVGYCADGQRAPRSCCSASIAARHHPGAGQRRRRSPALDHALPQRPLPPASRPDRSARPRATRATSPDNCDGSKVTAPRRAHAIAAGAVQLSDAIARWWVLDDDHRADAAKPRMGFDGHAAAVFGDELYDVLAQTRGGYGRLQDFGIPSATNASCCICSRGSNRPTGVQHRADAAAARA